MPSRSPRLRTACAAALLAAGLAACGSGSGTAGGATPSPTASRSTPTSFPSAASPAATEGTPEGVQGQLAGAGYVFTLPEGWEDATAQFTAYSDLIDAGAVNAAQAGQAFSDNVNVLRDDDRARLPRARAEQQLADELRTAATEVEVHPPVSVDGVEAVHLTGRADAGAVTALTEQYVCLVDGASYFITFAHSAATPSAQREREVSSVLTSWSWD